MRYIACIIISIIILFIIVIGWSKFLKNEVVSEEDKKTVVIIAIVLTVISSSIVVPLLVDLEDYWYGLEIVALVLIYGLGMTLTGFVACYNKYRRLLKDNEE